MQTKEERLAWLAGLKSGDEVLVPDHGRFRSDQRIHSIARLTPTQFVLNDGRRADRKDGRVRGQYGTLDPVTQEDRDKAEQKRLNAWLSLIAPGGPRYGWTPLPVPVLRAMQAAYDAEMAKLEVKS